MILESVMPGTMAGVKSALRSGVGIKAGEISFTKGVILFPVDMAFLAFSFGSISLAHAPPDLNAKAYYSYIGCFFAFCFLVSIVTSIVCKISEDHFELSRDDQNQKWINPTVFCYGAASTTIAASLMLLLI